MQSLAVQPDGAVRSLRLLVPVLLALQALAQGTGQPAAAPSAESGSDRAWLWFGLVAIGVGGVVLTLRWLSQTGRIRISQFYWRRRALQAEQRADRAASVIRAGLIPHLAQTMRDRVFSALLSQRTTLIQTQESSTEQVGELEQRLAVAQSQFEGRIEAYERQLDELRTRPVEAPNPAPAKPPVRRRAVRRVLQPPKPAPVAVPPLRLSEVMARKGGRNGK
jgi:hypothetical protein